MNIHINPAVVQSVLGSGGQSEVANFLKTHLEMYGTGIPFDAVSTTMKSLLSIAALSNFDPNERLTYGPRNKEASILDAVLMLSAGFAEYPHRDWPQDPALFDVSLLKNQVIRQIQGVDTEFVAALFVAHGANPWVNRGGDIPQAVEQVFILGMSGLFERFLECDGALSADEVMDDLNWIDAMQSERHLDILRLVLSKGARFENSAHVVSVLSKSKPANARIVLESGACPDLNEKEINQLKKVWDKRADSPLEKSEYGALLSSFQAKMIQVATAPATNRARRRSL